MFLKRDIESRQRQETEGRMMAGRIEKTSWGLTFIDGWDCYIDFRISDVEGITIETHNMDRGGPVRIYNAEQLEQIADWFLERAIQMQADEMEAVDKEEE